MTLSPARCVRLLGVVGLAALSALTPACGDNFDTSRTSPARGTVGEEMYGVICDRVGAQALTEDLSGASFHDICHKAVGGAYADKVDESKLPGIDPQAIDDKGSTVSTDKQKTDRQHAVARIEALGNRRDDLIRALDATFPGTEKVGIKDLSNSDDKKTCNAPAKGGEGLLVDQISDMLGRMGDLYDDGTIPQSTESLSKVVDTFKQSTDAQAAWARLSSRNGYRPISTALGAMRPVVAYPHLRDLSNASLRLLSADSNPYQLDAKRDSNNQRIPVPGPGNAAFNTLLQAGHEELLATTADPVPTSLTIKPDATTGRNVLSRPRDNLEMLSQVLFASDPAFGGGGSSSQYIVKRDSRGYAAITGGLVPAPFVDADNDGLPDVDDLGRFKTSDNSTAPSPFPYPGGANGSRDSFGRALAGSGLLYDYLDTSHTYAAQMLSDLKPLVNPDPKALHETLMDALGGMYIAMGPRTASSKAYSDKSLSYNGISVKDSPMLDLIYAMSVILSDQSTDATLALAHDLFANQTAATARATGAVLNGLDIAQKHAEAGIPKTSTYWDENLDTMAAIAKEPGLLEDVLRALADPATANLGTIFSNYAKYKDQISYNVNDINGPAWNVTTNSTGEMSTPVDRTQPETGDNRSALYRFLELISDTTGVTACNRDSAVVHAKLLGISLDAPLGGGSYPECAVFKIENLGAFYLDAMVNASQFDDPSVPNKRGTFYLRDDTLRNGIGLGIGAASVGLMQDSSGLTGFWTATNSTTLAPTPQWLDRLVFFDTVNDHTNQMTNDFITGLQPQYFGTSICPERVIADPNTGAPDASPDGMVHGLRNCPDGQWLQQRGKNTIFTWENFGFFDGMKPLLSAFVKHKREDLFLALSNSTFRHWPGKEASTDECRLAGGATCAREGMDSYEPLLTEVLGGDVIPAVSSLAAALMTMPINRCDAADATGACTKTTAITGIDAAAAATRAMLDPDYAKSLGLTDRAGNVTSKRNDGTTNPQITPAYLLTQALSGIDATFDNNLQQHPDDKDRQANWHRARSQLADQFLGVSGGAFTNASIPKMIPVVIDLLRSQLLANCPNSFSPPYATCDWARTQLTKKAEATIGGPIVSSGLDMMESLRADADGRAQMETLLQYLLDQASQNDALPSVLASSNDLIQLLRDDTNLVPLYHVLASGMNASIINSEGQITEKSLVDANMALLARVSGKYFDRDGAEICKNEVDPNQVLAVALGHLVTPVTDGSFNGQSPLEVIIDVIADVNRIDPSQKYDGTLSKDDYASVSSNVVDFLTNKENGLEQFYAVIRNGTSN